MGKRSGSEARTSAMQIPRTIQSCAREPSDSRYDRNDSSSAGDWSVFEADFTRYWCPRSVVPRALSAQFHGSTLNDILLMQETSVRMLADCCLLTNAFFDICALRHPTQLAAQSVFCLHFALRLIRASLVRKKKSGG